MAGSTTTLPVRDSPAENARRAQQREVEELLRSHREENAREAHSSPTTTASSQKSTATSGPITFESPTTFSRRDPKPRKVVVPSGTETLEIIDLTDEPEPTVVIKPRASQGSTARDWQEKLRKDSSLTSTKVTQQGSSSLQPAIEREKSSNYQAPYNDISTLTSKPSSIGIWEDCIPTSIQQDDYRSNDVSDSSNKNNTLAPASPDADCSFSLLGSSATPHDNPTNASFDAETRSTSDETPSQRLLGSDSYRPSWLNMSRSPPNSLKPNPQKGRKLRLSDPRPETSNTKLREQRLDRASILTSPPKLSRQPSWKALEEHKNDRGFARNGLNDDLRQQWAPELGETLRRLSPELLKGEKKSLVVKLPVGTRTQGSSKQIRLQTPKCAIQTPRVTSSGRAADELGSRPMSGIATPTTPLRSAPNLQSIHSVRRQARKRKIIDLSDQESDHSDDESALSKVPVRRTLFPATPSTSPKTLDFDPDSPRQKRDSRLRAEQNMAKIAREFKLPTSQYEKEKGYDTVQHLAANGLNDRMSRMSVTPTPTSFAFTVRPKPKPKFQPALAPTATRTVPSKITSSSSISYDTTNQWTQKRINGDRHVAKQRRIRDPSEGDVAMKDPSDLSDGEEDLPDVERFEMMDGIIVDKRGGK